MPPYLHFPFFGTDCFCEPCFFGGLCCASRVFRVPEVVSWLHLGKPGVAPEDLVLPVGPSKHQAGSQANSAESPSSMLTVSARIRLVRSSFSPNWLLILMCGAQALNRSSSAQGRTNHSSKLILAGSNSQDAHRCSFGCPRRPMLRVLQSFQLPDSCFRRPQAKLKAFCHPISRLRTGPCGGYGNVSGRGCQGRWPKALRAAVSRYHSCISITCPPKLRSSSEYVWDGCL